MPPEPHLPLLELVPNVSVGRDRALVEALTAEVHTALAIPVGDGSSAELADVHVDDDHDRTVFTLIGRGEALKAGFFALARASVDSTDIHAGHGVHPRIGVLDVVPVIALDDDIEAAHDFAHSVATYIGDELRVPCVHYGIDAPGESSFTGAVRRGGGPAAIERVRAGELELLAGPDELHPTAGMTMVGVREVLVAFNVDLAVDDLDAARDIARRIRAATDGPDSLDGVRALGLRLPRRQPPHAQVSTNIERHASVGPARVLETIARLAADAGIELDRAELVGLAPDSALGPLRYSCTRLAIPLAAAPNPSLDAAAARLR